MQRFFRWRLMHLTLSSSRGPRCGRRRAVSLWVARRDFGQRTRALRGGLPFLVEPVQVRVVVRDPFLDGGSRLRQRRHQPPARTWVRALIWTSPQDNPLSRFMLVRSGGSVSSPYLLRANSWGHFRVSGRGITSRL